MDLGRHVHFPHVKLINVSIFISSQKVKGFHWIPSQTGTFVGQVSFDKFGLSSQIELENPSVNPSANSDLEFHWIEPRLKDTITTPLETTGTITLFDIPDLKLFSCTQKPSLINIKRDRVEIIWCEKLLFDLDGFFVQKVFLSFLMIKQLNFIIISST